MEHLMNQHLKLKKHDKLRTVAVTKEVKKIEEYMKQKMTSLSKKDFELDYHWTDIMLDEEEKEDAENLIQELNQELFEEINPDDLWINRNMRIDLDKVLPQNAEKEM